MKNLNEELLYQIALFCIEANTTSINPIQYEFGLGFNIVIEVLNELEKRGIVSSKCGTKGRKILVDKEDLNHMFNKSTALQELNKDNNNPIDILNEFILDKEFYQDLQESFLEQISLETKASLNKYDLLDSIFKTVELPGMINIGFSDYAHILNKGNLFAYCKEEIQKDGLPSIVELTKPGNSIEIIFNIFCKDEVNIEKHKYIIDFFKKKYPMANIIYGISYDNDLEEGKLGVFALLVTKKKMI